MRIGLTAKLSLLAALLVFVTTIAVGTIFFRSARSVVRGREVDALRDAAELARRELLSAYDHATADLLAVAGSGDARSLLSKPNEAEGPRRRLATAAGRLFDARLHYLELAVVAVDLREAARIERSADGWQAITPPGLKTWQDHKDDLALTSSLTAPAVGFSNVRRGPAAGPDQVETLATPVVGSDGLPAGWIFLRLDFAALAGRLNRSARQLGFLVDQDGTYLVHPDAADIWTSKADSPLDAAFAELADAEQAGTLRKSDLKLPGLADYAASVRFSNAPDRQRLRTAREAIIRAHPGLRISRGDDLSDRLVFRASAPEPIRLALDDLRERLDTRAESDGPYRCETYLACLLPVRLEVSPTQPAAATPYFGLALASAQEEVEHDIVADYWRNFLFSAMLAVAAGGGTMAFAVVLTGSLRRMTAYAEKVAAGNEAEVELLGDSMSGYQGGRDEIGTLVRAFRKMIDHVRRRTRELRESEARIRTILNTAAEGIITIDQSGRLESFNLAAERIFGYSPAEVRGEHFRKLLLRGAPDDMPSLLGAASLAARAGDTNESSLMSISRVNNTTREVIGRRRNGRAFPLEMSVSEVVLGDRLVYTAIMRDITDRKEAEAQIRQMTEELEQRVRDRTSELVQANQALESARDLALEANRAKDAFLAVMSHELRTPLTAIIGYCDYWLGEADERDPAEMFEDLRKMHVSARHLLTLINDILDLAKIQAGKLVLDLSEFDLPPLMAELEDWVEPLIRTNGNSLTVESSSGLGGLRSDRTRVRQVLLNLLSNAAKFTTNGSIRLEACRHADQAGRDEIIFRVSDTGVGMKPEDVKRLFQPFVQVDSSNTRKHEGTGLGLAICRRLCELMGGTIEADSRVGAGTTFTVRLPAYDASGTGVDPRS